MRTWLADGLRENLGRYPVAHRIHQVGAVVLAEALAATGRRWPAAQRLLLAWRYAGDERVNPDTVRRVDRLIEAECDRGSKLAPLGENGFVAEFLRSRAARSLLRLWRTYPLEDRVRLRKPRPQQDPERQGNLMLLKTADPATGEKGVLLAMYSPTLPELAAVFDHARLVQDYRLVLEPSTWGYQDPAFLLYLGCDADVVVLAQRRQDFEYIADHGRNLRPLRLGAGDWVDPDRFHPSPSGAFDFDVVMVSAWDPIKRHDDLFEALQTIRVRHGRTLRVALIGYAMRWSRDRIERMMRHWGVADQCRIFELIPPGEVADIVSRSAVSVLLSHREGANRAIYESFFCDTPVLVPRNHVGVNLDHVNEATGMLFDDDSLALTLLTAIDQRAHFRPRAWALANTGWENSTRRLNESLKDLATRRGEPWTRNIAARKNEPNLRYARAGENQSFEAAYRTLKDYLRPAD